MLLLFLSDSATNGCTLEQTKRWQNIGIIFRHTQREGEHLFLLWCVASTLQKTKDNKAEQSHNKASEKRVGSWLQAPYYPLKMAKPAKPVNAHHWFLEPMKHIKAACEVIPFCYFTNMQLWHFCTFWSYTSYLIISVEVVHWWSNIRHIYTLHGEERGLFLPYTWITRAYRCRNPQNFNKKQTQIN